MAAGKSFPDRQAVRLFLHLHPLLKNEMKTKMKKKTQNAGAGSGFGNASKMSAPALALDERFR